MIILPGDAKKAKKKERSMNAARVPRSVRKNYLDLLDQQVKYLKAQTANLSNLLTGGADRATVATTLAQMSAEAQARLDQLAPGTARSFVTAASIANKEAIQRNIASALSVDFATVIDGPDIKPLLDQAIVDNVGMIKSIGQEHFAKVGRAVLDNYRGVPQVGDVSLTKRLQDIGNISKNRAKFIARDQTAKLTGDLNQARQQDNGIDEYDWKNAGDQRVVGNPSGLYPKGNRVHGDHWHRENKRFSWSKPPPDGHPGHAPGCRCYAKPVLNLDKLKAQYI
jgi:SPP1 gp7 family putative phage head morphogenesis protein